MNISIKLLAAHFVVFIIVCLSLVGVLIAHRPVDAVVVGDRFVEIVSEFRIHISALWTELMEFLIKLKHKESIIIDRLS